MWAAEAVPRTARWLLDTSLMWLSKSKGEPSKHNDEDWSRLAQEDAMVAEVTDKGLLAMPTEEALDILQSMQAVDRKEFVVETLMVAARAVPLSASDDLWALVDTVPLRTQAEFLTVEGMFEAWLPARMQDAQLNNTQDGRNIGTPSDHQTIRPLHRRALQ